jgi:hypothetical protein
MLVGSLKEERRLAVVSKSRKVGRKQDGWKAKGGRVVGNGSLKEAAMLEG